MFYVRSCEGIYVGDVCVCATMHDFFKEMVRYSVSLTSFEQVLRARVVTRIGSKSEHDHAMKMFLCSPRTETTHNKDIL